MRETCSATKLIDEELLGGRKKLNQTSEFAGRGLIALPRRGGTNIGGLSVP